MERALSCEGDFSIRLRERMNEPLYYTDKSEVEIFLADNKPGTFSANILLPQDDKIIFFGLINKNQPECPIIDIKYWTNIQDERLAFIDTVAQMCINKNEQNLESLSVREIENYLRDFNNIPAFPVGDMVLYPALSKIIEGLKSAIAGSRGRRIGLKESPTLSEDYKPLDKVIFAPTAEEKFTELTLQEQNKLVNQVIEKHIRPFLYRDYGDIECLFIDGSMIVIQYLGACSQCTKSLTTTMDYIQNVLRKELSENSIIVVTDS